MNCAKFTRYEAYKDSGVEWLGEVPSKWRIAKVKSTCSHLRDGTHGSFQRVDDGYPLLSVRNIVNSKFVLLTDDSQISESDYKIISKSLKIKGGDLQLAIVGATLGKVALVPENMPKFVTQRSLATLRPIVKFLCNKFFFYFSSSSYFQDTLWSKANYSAQPGVYLYTISNIDILLPSIHEQQAIATCLDTKTAQIDRKIDLLSQKAAQYGKLKQSLINETVTRGLNKTVALKDSGVEWVGGVPEHWEVRRVKELFAISRGRVIAQTELVDDGEFPVYSSQTKDDGCLGYINTFDYDGLYITWTTDGVNAGTVFLRNGKFNCTNICGTLKLTSKNCDIAYLFYSLQVSTKHNKRIDTNGAKIMSNEMMFIKICIPPIEEQTNIANYLDEKTAHIDRIVTTINSQIDKLKELRKTLINDVVTGKIKITTEAVYE